MTRTPQILTPDGMASPSDNLLMAIVKRLTNWSWLLARRQVGKTSAQKQDHAFLAARELHGMVLMTRAELSALVNAAYASGAITPDQFKTALAFEADRLNMKFEQQFPGVRSTDAGLHTAGGKEAGTFNGWPE